MVFEEYVETIEALSTPDSDDHIMDMRLGSHTRHCLFNDWEAFMLRLPS
jgi:hypothetical protein